MTQPERRNKERMKAYIQAWDDQDVEAIGTFLSDDNPQYSPEGVRDVAEDWFEAFPDLDHEILELAANGEWVLARLQLTGTHEGTFKGIPPTGNQIEITDHVSSRFEDGVLVEHHATADFTSMFRQLGIRLPDDETRSTRAAVVRRYFEAINERDRQAYKATLAPDFRYGSIEGPREMAETAWRWVEAMDLRWDIQALHVADEYVTSRVRATGTHTDEILGLEPTDESFEVTAITVGRVIDGQITNWWGEWDFTGLLDQIGVLDMPASDE